VIGLDTNVLARYIVQDHPGQSAAAARLMEGQCTAQTPGYVSVLVLAELVWVLTRAYGFEKDAVIPVIRQFLRTEELAVEDRDAVRAALREFESGAGDFADCLIACRNRMHGCARTYTFDLRAARGKHFALLR